MTVPVFEEYEPAADCDCAGCAQQRRALAAGGHPSVHGCRKALVVVAAAGVVLGGGPATAAATATATAVAPAAGAVTASTDRTDRTEVAVEPDPGTEQGSTGPLHGRPLPGPSGRPAAGSPAPQRRITRADIINRAKRWVAAQVPYSMQQYWSDGYRQDCSGFVSMAWQLAGNEWTGSLARFGTRITREELQPGDILLFHNPDNPSNGSHVTIFGGWTDFTHTYYVAYEQTKPHTRKQVTPMAYWENSDKYLPYRYNGLAGSTTTTTGGAKAARLPAFPGRGYFRPGRSSAYVTQLGRQLVERGFGKHYAQGPGPRWSEADRRNVQAFQRAQGWRGGAADGFPGPETWRRLFRT